MAPTCSSPSTSSDQVSAPAKSAAKTAIMPRTPRHDVVNLGRLGRVDGFENDQAECECDERPEVPVGLLAAERDALEALELSHELLDAGARPVERLREEGRPLLGRGLHGDNRADASLAGRSPVGLGIIAFVAYRGAYRARGRAGSRTGGCRSPDPGSGGRRAASRRD